MSSDCLGIRTVCSVGSANSLISNGHRDVAKRRRNCDQVTAWTSSIRGAATTKKKSCPCILCPASPDSPCGERPSLAALCKRGWQAFISLTNLAGANFLALCVVNFASFGKTNTGNSIGVS
jgi:hypothetical protein